MTELSLPANLAWQLAVQEAAAAQFEFIETEHILIGICSLEKLLAMADEAKLEAQAQQTLTSEKDAIEDILRDLGLYPRQIRRSVRQELGEGHYARTEQTVHRSPACKQVFERAAKRAEFSNEVSCIHLFAAIMDQPTPVITKVLEARGVVIANLRDRTLAHFATHPAATDEPLKVHVGEPKQDQSNTPILDSYGRDLTQAAREGKLGPFVGRRKELLQIIQTLARTSKNNPVLVGEAGVGKTAVVEALALRIFEGRLRSLKGQENHRIEHWSFDGWYKVPGRIRGTAGEDPE